MLLERPLKRSKVPWIFSDFLARLAGLKILARFAKAGPGFSPGWIPLHAIDNLQTGLEFSARPNGPENLNAGLLRTTCLDILMGQTSFFKKDFDKCKIHHKIRPCSYGDRFIRECLRVFLPGMWESWLILEAVHSGKGSEDAIFIQLVVSQM